MSLILDALRKSETERRRGQAPGLFTPLPTVGAQVQSRRSLWPWLVAVVVVLLALIAWWYRPVPAASVVTFASPTPTVVAAPTPIPAPVVVASPKPIAGSSPQRTTVAAPAAFQSPSPLLPESAPTRPDVVVMDLPTLAMLDPSERAALPPLKLSMHVWSEAPNARLAIIDGQRVMEGSAIGESIVAEIRRDGVVLEVHGRRFLLPRP